MYRDLSELRDSRFIPIQLFVVHSVVRRLDSFTCESSILQFAVKMSLSLTRTLLNASSKLVRCSSQLKQATGRVNTALYAGIQSENSAGTLTRSLGTMCRRADDTRAQKHNAFCRCGCRGLHTQGNITVGTVFCAHVVLLDQSRAELTADVMSIVRHVSDDVGFPAAKQHFSRRLSHQCTFQYLSWKFATV